MGSITKLGDKKCQNEQKSPNIPRKIEVLLPNVMGKDD